MLGLVPYLLATGVMFDPSDTKIHLACWNGIEEPINVYYRGEFQAWQEGQNRRNFECQYVMSLIDLGRGNWLFAGIYRVLGCQPHPTWEGGHYLYSTELLPGQSDLVGRLIIEHQRTRQSYVWCKPEMALQIVEIKREKMTIADFPGYHSIVINHDTLKTIIRMKIDSWYSALANIRGVYLIVDTTNGKPYVGKASGDVGIWQRWSTYADNGHGGNKELIEVLVKNGEEYMKNFQYSLLEIADTYASEKYILAREAHWMKALMSRKFGLN